MRSKLENTFQVGSKFDHAETMRQPSETSLSSAADLIYEAQRAGGAVLLCCGSLDKAGARGKRASAAEVGGKGRGGGGEGGKGPAKALPPGWAAEEHVTQNGRKYMKYRGPTKGHARMSEKVKE